MDSHNAESSIPVGLTNVYCNANFSERDSNLGIHAEVRKHPSQVGLGAAPGEILAPALAQAVGSSMVGYG